MCLQLMPTLMLQSKNSQMRSHLSPEYNHQLMLLLLLPPTRLVVDSPADEFAFSRAMMSPSSPSLSPPIDCVSIDLPFEPLLCPRLPFRPSQSRLPSACVSRHDPRRILAVTRSLSK